MKTFILLSLLLIGATYSNAQIPNDDCINAALLTLNVSNQATDGFDTTMAMASGVSPSCETSPVDGWYSFVMPFNGNALITASNGNTEFAIYDSCGGAEVGCISPGSHIFNLMSGTTYFLQAWRKNGTSGPFTFTLTLTEIIANDECATAEALSLDANNQAMVTLNTNGATISTPDPSCETNARDGWYSFTMPFNGNALISASSGNTEFAIYDSCGGVEVGCISPGSHIFNLTSGTTYYLRAWRKFGTDGSFDFTLTATETIANDECATAEALSLDANNQAMVTLNTNGATISTPDPSCETNARDGWYSFTMPFNGNALISASSGNTEFAIYDSCGGAEVGCISPGSHIFNLTSGTTYYLRAWRKFGTDGSFDFTLTVTETIVNDECANAIDMIFDSSFASTNSFDTNGATPSLNAAPSCDNNEIRDGWYKITSPINGSYQIGGSGNTEFAVYDACDGIEIACINNNGTFNVVQGEEYIIRGWRRFGTDGTMNVNLTPTITPVSDGSVGSCEAIPTVTIDASNNNEWVNILDATGDVVAAIKANGQNLGDITTNLQIDANNIKVFGPANKPYLRRDVEISPIVQPTSPVDVRIYLLGAEFDDLMAADISINDIGDLNLYKEDVAGCAPGYAGNGVRLTSTNGNYDGADYYMEVSVSSFSTFFPVGSATTLPVELTSFSGNANGDVNDLAWSTATEENTDRFEVERSGNGIDWEYLGEVKAVGDSTIPQSYTFKDGNPFSTSFYRLKIVDNDASFEYSDIVRIANGASISTVNVYPNPVRDQFIIEHQNSRNVQNISLLNINGQVVKNITITNSNSVNVEGLSAGIYFLRITTRNGTETVKIVKQ